MQLDATIEPEAGIRAGLREIPVRYAAFSRDTLTSDEFIRELAKHNETQRVKTNAEHLREILVGMSREDAYQELVEYREGESYVPAEGIELGEKKRRARISSAKGPFLAAIKRVIQERRNFWPLSDRAVHYGLVSLNEPPLIHASKKDSRYRNDKASYRALTGLLTRARLTGQIPMTCICDETRPISIWDCHPGPRDFLAREVDEFLNGYSRDLMKEQPNHLELLGEKLTVKSILERVAAKYRIPQTIGRGYCSLKPRYDMLRRFRKSGKGKLILLIVSGFDPDGEAIAESFARSMRDDFNLEDVHAIKVALTEEQIQRFDLPPTMDAKKSSPNYKKFLAENGGHAYELEALPPATLQEIVEDGIRSVLDLAAFDASRDAERDDAVFLASVRRQVREATEGIEL